MELEKIKELAEKKADEQERRGTSAWQGVYHGFIFGYQASELNTKALHLRGVSGCSLEVIEKLADCNISQNHTGKWGVIFGTFSRTYNFMHKEKKEVLEWIRQNCR